MARLSYPLGFSIKDNTGIANSGVAIDERMVYATDSDKSNFPVNFLYRGQLSYVCDLPYHVSGTTSNSGLYIRYYNGSVYSWQGLDADTVDDKHANGTIDSASTSTVDPTTTPNITNHLNYLYTLVSAVSTSRSWLDSVPDFADLATTYPTPTAGQSSLVESENKIYTYNGTIWVPTSAGIAELSASQSGIVNKTWYSTLNDLITYPSKYSNQNAVSRILIKDISGLYKANGYVYTTNPTDTVIFQEGSNIVINANDTSKTITISANPSTPVSPTGPENAVQLKRSSSFYGDSYFTFDGVRIGLGSPTSKNTIIGSNSATSLTTGSFNVLIGGNAGRDLTTGVYNVAMGLNALLNNNAGDFNTSIGEATLLGNTVGNYNTALGALAGSGKNGNNNLYIGRLAGYSPTTVSESDRLYIMSDGNNSLIYGELDNSVVRIIGSSPTPSLEFGDNSIYIKRDGSDNLVFKDPLTQETSLTDLISAGTFTASNGLTKQSNDVKLGGTLTENTELNLNTYSLSTVSISGASQATSSFSINGFNWEVERPIVGKSTIYGYNAGSIEGAHNFSGLGAVLSIRSVNITDGIEASINVWPSRVCITGSSPAVYSTSYGDTGVFTYSDFTLDDEIVNKKYVDTAIFNAVSGGTITIGGVNTNIQYNNNGSLGGSSLLTFDSARGRTGIGSSYSTNSQLKVKMYNDASLTNALILNNKSDSTIFKVTESGDITSSGDYYGNNISTESTNTITMNVVAGVAQEGSWRFRPSSDYLYIERYNGTSWITVTTIDGNIA
jgi:hypothetical protein